MNLSFLDCGKILEIRLVSRRVNQLFLNPDFWPSFFRQRFRSDCCIPKTLSQLTDTTKLDALTPEIFSEYLFHAWRSIIIDEFASTQPGCYPIKHLNTLAWNIGGLPFGLRPYHCPSTFQQSKIAGFGVDLRKFGFATRCIAKKAYSIEVYIPHRPELHWRSVSLHLFDRKGNETRNVIFISTESKVKGYTFRFGNSFDQLGYVEIVSIEDSCEVQEFETTPIADQTCSSITKKMRFSLKEAEIVHLDTEELLEDLMKKLASEADSRTEDSVQDTIFIESSPTGSDKVTHTTTSSYHDLFDYKLDYNYGIRNDDASFFITSEKSRLVVKIFDSRKQRYREWNAYRNAYEKKTHLSCLDSQLEALAGIR